MIFIVTNLSTKNIIIFHEFPTDMKIQRNSQAVCVIKLDFTVSVYRVSEVWPIYPNLTSYDQSTHRDLHVSTLTDII